MFQILAEALLLTTASWIGWCYVKQYIFKGPLENIAGPPASFLRGNLREVFNINAWNIHKDIAAHYGSVIKIKALLGESQLYVFDPKAMHHIVVKDQYVYERSVEASRLTFGPGLFSTLGEKHKKQRKMLNPVFSTAHMKEMVPIFWEVSHKLGDTLLAKVKKGADEVDMAYWMTRMALELIGQSGLGYSFDPLTEDAPPHPYGQAVKQLIPVLGRLTALRGILPVLTKIGTPGFRRWLLNITPSANLHHLRDITDMMHNTSVEILEHKRKAFAEGDEAVARQVARGKDIMSILLKANMEASEEDSLPEEEVTAQMSSLIFAAMDSTSNALSRILNLLSIHEDIQEKLRREVTEALNKHGDLEYDELVSLPFLDAVCRETLRLYPPVTHVTRIAAQDITLPLSNAIKGVDGKLMNEVYVPKGTTIYVSIHSANRNPNVWGEDASEWKPERWLAPLPDSVKDAHIPGVYSHMMTFIGGGRACIGFKFSQLEMKIVLAMLLKTFRFAPSDKEIFWAMNVIVNPAVVGKDPAVASLPLKISLV